MKRFPTLSLPLILATACLLLPLTTLAQQQNFGSSTEFEYIEHWTAQFPPTEFPEPRSDLNDEDVILYYRTVKVADYRNPIEFYAIDKKTGNYLSKLSTEFTADDDYHVVGYTVYRGNVWIVIGQAIEHMVGTLLLVADVRTGQQKNMVDGRVHMDSFDFCAEVLTVGDSVFAMSATALVTPSDAIRSQNGLRLSIREFSAESGEQIGVTDLHDQPYQPSFPPSLEPIMDELIVFGIYPIVIKENSFELMDLRDAKLGNNRLGYPHIVRRMSEDLYAVEWDYNYFSYGSGAREIRLTRIYRWSPANEPEVLWDSWHDLGFHSFGGVLDETSFWMHSSEGTAYYISLLNPSATREARSTNTIPGLMYPAKFNELPLVIRSESDGTEALAILIRNFATSIDLNDKIKFDIDSFDWIVNGQQVLGRSTLSTPAQIILTFGEIQFKPTSR